jgi:hypothetical protein
MLNMIGCAAQFDREVMLERRRERIGGGHDGGAIAAKLGIGMASVYRALRNGP